ncbi:MAG TPA: hypothetical protein VFH35_02710, partial [Ramlibacter sp.]|nr:hypothetical protein [Ramlibacter sp.]
MTARLLLEVLGSVELAPMVEAEPVVPVVAEVLPVAVASLEPLAVPAAVPEVVEPGPAGVACVLAAAPPAAPLDVLGLEDCAKAVPTRAAPAIAASRAFSVREALIG